jgi:tetratricopeptide (TPR) repeat protein
MYEDAIAVYEQIGNKSDKARALNALAGVYEDLSRELDAKDNIASHLENIGNIQLAQGDVSGGLALLRQALAESKTGHNKLLQAGILNSMGKALAAQANFAEAEEAHAEASALISQVGGNLSHAANQLGTAELMIVENHYAQAEMTAREVVKEFEKQRERDGLLEAREILARSLLGTKQCNAASEEIGRALTLAKQSQDPRLRASVAITESRIQGACDSGSSSRRGRAC